MKSLALTVLPGRLAICRLAADAPLPAGLDRAHFCSVTRTPEELSLVLPEEMVEAGWQAETGYRALQVLGPLDLSLTGVLAALAAPLAAAGVSIFAISTYDTDYVLVREGDLGKAQRALVAAGHEVTEWPGQ
ncbi:MAG: ACT domain-containing protein [Anaerolineae bacterium]|nr:ACT domain-containing protein [Anaerolineae bacterium]